MRKSLACFAVAMAMVVPGNTSGTSSAANLIATNEDGLPLFARDAFAKASQLEQKDLVEEPLVGEASDSEELPPGTYFDSLKPRYFDLNRPIGKMVPIRSREIRLQQINVVARPARVQNAGMTSEEIAQETATQVTIKAAAFAGGPYGMFTGWGMCHMLRHQQLLRYKEKHNEYWTTEDHFKNWAQIGFDCSPLGFIARLQEATNPIEGLAIALGGVANFAPLPPGPGLGVTLFSGVSPLLRTEAKKTAPKKVQHQKLAKHQK